MKYSKQLIMVSIFIYLVSINADLSINFYYIPINDVVTNQNNNCAQINSSYGVYGNCTCKISQNHQLCSYSFNPINILPYISFRKPAFIVKDMIIYGYYVNNGINNFKLLMDSNHHALNIPIVNYYYKSDHKTIVIDITDLD
jgi:hypothetical protein